MMPWELASWYFWVFLKSCSLAILKSFTTQVFPLLQYRFFTMPSASHERRLWIALGVAATTALAEIVMSVFTASNALLADGFHHADDVAVLLLGLSSTRSARRRPGIKRTLGFKRLNKLTGFAKGCIFIMSATIVFLKVIQSFLEQKPVDSQTVILVGSIAFLVNFASALVLRGSQTSFDAKTAYNAFMYDALGSLIVLASGVFNIALQMEIFDELASLLLGLYMLRAGWILVAKGSKVFLRTFPKEFDFAAFEQAVLAQPNVVSLSDLHVWKLTHGEYHLTCRITLRTHSLRESAQILRDLNRLCRTRFHIQHATIQPRYTWDILDASQDYLGTSGSWPGSAVQFWQRERVMRVMAMQMKDFKIARLQ